MTTYYPRLIDRYLLEWSKRPSHKPILLRGARQVGKSSAVRHLGESFNIFIEINFEKRPELKNIFKKDLNVDRIVRELEIVNRGKKVIDGETLLFFDEIQECPEAIMALRYFKEDRSSLHVIAAGSLLEFAIEDLPTFGVGRIHTMFMYPMSFDEFLLANEAQGLIEIRNEASPMNPLSTIAIDELISLFRSYILVGGMPEVVDEWIKTRSYIQCQELQDDLLLTYEADFSKYKGKSDANLLLDTLKGAALQLGNKFVYTKLENNYKAEKIKSAINLLVKAGLLNIVYKTSANGLPLGGEIDKRYFKLLLLDSGLTLRLLNYNIDELNNLSLHVLTSKASDLVNKGSLTEMVAGLEIMRYQSPNIRQETYYWSREEKNSLAEVDYLTALMGNIIPIEVKSGTQGGMKSLWMFMDLKNISIGLRTSLENFGVIKQKDSDRKVIICPLFALSQIQRIYHLEMDSLTF